MKQNPEKSSCWRYVSPIPGGNFHWQDFDIMKWGEYNIPPSRSFTGIIGRVKLESVNPVFISDIYMQNTPELTKVNAILSFTNETSSSVKQDVELIVNEKGNPDKVVFRQTLKAISFPAGNHEVTNSCQCSRCQIMGSLYSGTVYLQCVDKEGQEDARPG